MSIFSKFTVSKAAASNLSFAAGIGGAINSIAAPLVAGSVQKESAKTRALVAGINAKRMARSLRYAQGSAAVSRAAGGGSQFGSALAAMADDARSSDEKLSDLALQTKFNGINEQARTPTIGLGAIDFVTKASTAIANRSYDKLKG